MRAQDSPQRLAELAGELACILAGRAEERERAL
jgi:hypothetical protein